MRSDGRATHEFPTFADANMAADVYLAVKLEELLYGHSLAFNTCNLTLKGGTAPSGLRNDLLGDGSFRP